MTTSETYLKRRQSGMSRTTLRNYTTKNEGKTIILTQIFAGHAGITVIILSFMSRLLNSLKEVRGIATHFCPASISTEKCIGFAGMGSVNNRFTCIDDANNYIVSKFQMHLGRLFDLCVQGEAHEIPASCCMQLQHPTPEY
jgi:hypothetical protein